MSDETNKKRKRPAKDASDELHPKKSRIVEAAPSTSTDHVDLGPVSNTKKDQKDGILKQEKSERRSKKAKKQRAAKTITTEDETSTDNLANGKDFVALTDVPTETKAPTNPTKSSKSSEPSSTSNKPTRTKFIVFVGNLPYTTSTPQISAHFAKLAPFSIRHNTDKTTGRSKGIAFLEFEGYDKMKTCLKLYHHSMFDPKPADTADGDEAKKSTTKTTGRKINVELTVGGGGKGKGRKEKLKKKNTRLEEQRERARVKTQLEETKEKERSTKKEKLTDANATPLQAQSEVDGRGDIHPSRLNRVAR